MLTPVGLAGYNIIVDYIDTVSETWENIIKAKKTEVLTSLIHTFLLSK